MLTEHVMNIYVIPSKWFDVETHLKRLDQNTKDNTVINIARAVQLLNAGYIDELAEWKWTYDLVTHSQWGGGGGGGRNNSNTFNHFIFHILERTSFTSNPLKIGLRKSRNFYR